MASGRIGGRGCPRCGSHDTLGLGKTGAQICNRCDYRWLPCGDQYCRGYRVTIDPEPTVMGCPDCDAEHGGVPLTVVRWWPEAWRALARSLNDNKLEPIPAWSGVRARA
jgi:hypothetical protein